MVYDGNKVQVPIMLNTTIKIKFSISMPKTLIDIFRRDLI